MSIDEEKLLQAFREWHLNTYFSPPSSALVIHEARWEGFRAGAKFASGFDTQGGELVSATATHAVRKRRKPWTTLSELGKTRSNKTEE
jgi:hypothetical protein